MSGKASGRQRPSYGLGLPLASIEQAPNRHFPFDDMTAIVQLGIGLVKSLALPFW